MEHEFFELITQACRPALGQDILVNGALHVLLFHVQADVQQRVEGNSIFILDQYSKRTQDADMKENAYCVLCVVVYYTIRVFVHLHVHTYAHMHRAFVPALWQGRAAHKTFVICVIAMTTYACVYMCVLMHSNLSIPPPSPQQQRH